MYLGQIILLSARVREGHILKAKFRLGGKAGAQGGSCPPAGAAHAKLYCSAYRPCIPSGSLSRVPSASAGVRVGAGRKVASAGWQVTLCDPTWHVTSRSGDAGLLTKGEPLYRVYLLFFTFTQLVNTTRQNVGSAVSDGSCVSAIRNAGIRLTVCQSTSTTVMSHACDSDSARRVPSLRNSRYQ